MPALSPINEILTLYGALIYGLLLAAGLVLAVLRYGFHTHVPQAWSSLTGWLLMVPLATAAVLLGREAVVLFVTAASVLGYWEYARATGLTKDRQLAHSACLGVLAVGMVSLSSGAVLRGPAYYEVFMALPVALTAGILLVPVLGDRFQGQIRLLAVAVVGCLYFGWMAGHISLLANAEHAYAYLLFLVFAVEVNDVAAFAGGRLFGRTSLRKSISPSKTWEGALAGMAVSLALPWLLWSTFPHFRWWDLVAIGVIIGAGGQLGDLVISVIKRDVGLKNMGAVIPGHGGVLDRIDSLIYVAPLFTHYIRFRHGLNLGA